MQILLPPSEGKTTPLDADPVDLDTLSFPELTGDRVDLMSSLVLLCRDDPVKAAGVLGLGPTQAAEVERNAALPHAAAAPARTVYTGVLYSALGLPTLTGDAAARADTSIVVTSSVFGVLRPADRIPAYRLSGAVRLPGIGTVSTFWRPILRDVLTAAAGDGLVLDVRSTTYAAFWRPPAALASRVVAIRVLHEANGRRTVVSHHSKATKGRLVRTLLTAPDVDSVDTPTAVAALLREHGWTVEVVAPERGNRPWTLDVIVTQVPTA